MGRAVHENLLSILPFSRKLLSVGSLLRPSSVTRSKDDAYRQKNEEVPSMKGKGGEGHTLISTSTPLGSSSCIRASTVSLLDERMSIRRLWWRRSNCSRLFLST